MYRRLGEPIRTISELEQLAPYRRVEIYRDGLLPRPIRTHWASRHPEEVPTINGEFEWLARDLADLD